MNATKPLSSSPPRERLSAVDTAWLRMDSPGNPMMICGVLRLARMVDRDALVALLRERFLSYRRFGERPVHDALAAYWEPCATLDLGYHVVEIAPPGPQDDEGLQRLVSDLAGRPLDPAHPLWQFHVVPFRGASALVVRIHHCYADGIALIGVMLSMTDGTGSRAEASASTRDPEPQWSGLDRALAPSTVVDTAARVAAALMDKGAEIWGDPAKARDLARRGTALAGGVAALALMRPDSPTALKGVPNGEKRVAWAEPLDLTEVKAIGRALGASVNDVVLSAVAGAFARYLSDRGEAIDGVTVRVLVPVNLRSADAAPALGNQFGLVFVELPLHLGNPVERLYAVRAGMRELRGSMQPVLSLGLLAAMGAGPKSLQDLLLAALARNATAVVTNVPGPGEALSLAGAPIESLMFWVPQAGNIGLGVSIISYGGKVQFGVIADRAVCEQPQLIAGAFAVDFERLVLATLMSPWPWTGDLDPELTARAVGAA